VQSSYTLHKQVCVQSTVLHSLFCVFIVWNNLKAGINSFSSGLYIFLIIMEYGDVSHIYREKINITLLTIFTVQMLL
jgi:hypothetical protein